MQSDYHEIYRLTAERTGKEEGLYKELGGLVFKELNGYFNRPESLLVNLRGVGRWYIRKKRMETILDLYPPDYGKNPEDFPSERAFLKNENKKELFDRFNQLLHDYEKFLEKKRRIKALRAAILGPLIPKVYEED